MHSRNKKPLAVYNKFAENMSEVLDESNLKPIDRKRCPQQV